jgi:hypothetical protein
VQTICNRPDSRATPSERCFNMETREVHYGKAVAQFTVRMLYASIQTRPREISDRLVLGLLSLQIEASRHVLCTELGIEFSIAYRWCLGRCCEDLLAL